MNSKDMWESLYSMETKEIEIQVAMQVVYLVKARGVKLKELFKDIKNICGKLV